MQMQSAFARLGIHLIVLLCAAGALSAQQPVGTISGVVTDAKGGVLADAEVSVGSKATGTSRTVTTNDTGFFLASNLQPGEYTVTIQFKGFAPYTAVVTVAVG